MALMRVPDNAERIRLNRAAGESYDEGQQMTMAEAMKVAEQYGHVPARISSGPMPSDTSGVWAVPTETGWVPLDRLTAQQAWSHSPQAGTADSKAQYGPGFTPPSPQAGSVTPSTTGPARPSVQNGPQLGQRAYGPPTQSGQYPTVGQPVTAFSQPQQQQQQPAQNGSTININIPPSPYGQPSAMHNPDYPYNPSSTRPTTPSGYATTMWGYDNNQPMQGPPQRQGGWRGYMGEPPPGQQSQGLNDPYSYIPPSPYGQPSAMHNQQYPYSPSYRMPPQPQLLNPGLGNSGVYNPNSMGPTLSR